MDLLFRNYRKIFCFLTLVFFLAASHPLYPQKKNKAVKYNKYFSFSFDNDVYFNTDKYYTNGFYFSLSGAREKLSGVENFLFPYHSGRKYFSASLIQRIFTPADFSTADVKYGDRPFSANLLFRYAIRNFNRVEKLIFTESVSIGAVGKYAYGKEVQNGIHSLLPHSSDVPGWENQISDGLLLCYFADIEKNILMKENFLVNFSAWGKLGTPQTAAGIKVHFLVSSTKSFFKAPFYASKKSFNYQTDFSAGAFYKFYDVNLQGNPVFDFSPYRIGKITRMLFHSEAGLQINLSKFVVETRIYFLTPEFPGGTNHLWGRLKIGYKF